MQVGLVAVRGAIADDAVAARRRQRPSRPAYWLPQPAGEPVRIARIQLYLNPQSGIGARGNGGRARAAAGWPAAAAGSVAAVSGMGKRFCGAGALPWKPERRWLPTRRAASRI